MDLNRLQRKLHTDNGVDSSHNQRYHDHRPVGHGLRDAGLGSATARSHRHHFLSHSSWPESVKDSFCSDAAEVDKGRAMAAVGLVVYHHLDESLQFDKGAKPCTTVSLARIDADRL